MNQTLLPAVIDDLMSMLPTAKPKALEVKGMTRREKLQHWATAVRAAPGSLHVFHLLERVCPSDLPMFGHPISAFHLAGTNPVLQDQGIKQDMPATIYGAATTSAAEVMRFFELSQAQLHEFSCDCGGSIGPGQMADRIEGIARRG